MFLYSLYFASSFFHIHYFMSLKYCTFRRDMVAEQNMKKIWTSVIFLVYSLPRRKLRRKVCKRLYFWVFLTECSEIWKTDTMGCFGRQLLWEFSKFLKLESLKLLNNIIKVVFSMNLYLEILQNFGEATLSIIWKNSV